MHQLSFHDTRPISEYFRKSSWLSLHSSGSNLSVCTYVCTRSAGYFKTSSLCIQQTESEALLQMVMIRIYRVCRCSSFGTPLVSRSKQAMSRLQTMLTTHRGAGHFLGRKPPLHSFNPALRDCFRAPYSGPQVIPSIPCTPYLCRPPPAPRLLPAP